MGRPELEFEGDRFRWTGREWLSASGYLEPPKVICGRLDVLARGQFEQYDKALASPDDILEEATAALENRRDFHRERAEHLSRRALAIRPGHAGSAAVLCSALRVGGTPVEALSIADRFLSTGYLPLLTCRAAALCDLGRQREAKRQIDQVIAIAKKSREPVSGEAWAAWRRIDAGCP